MARLELPVRAFTESFLKRAFPERDWTRGSGINDLVLKPFALILQPLRHEIDVTKINQTMLNYRYMREGDLDALAANWGKFRQRGARASGLVRLYFDTAADYRFDFLEFYDDAGNTYNLVAPVSISAIALMSNRKDDATFFYDVNVQSNGIGNRYVVPAGAITQLRNRPPNVVGCENIADFNVTTPDESNYDVVNSMYRNVGLKNLVSKASIRTPLYEQFPGIFDIYIAGSDSPKMVRDLRTVTINGVDTQVHLGGVTDVWCNTTSVSAGNVVLTYLPSSGRVDIVSVDQAAQNEVLFAFSRSFTTLEGMFTAPENFAQAILLDEAYTLNFNVAGLNQVGILTIPTSDNRQPLAIRDYITGTDLQTIPVVGLKSPYLLDAIGPNLGNTPVAVGDIISISASDRRRITRKTGRVLEVAPAVAQTHQLTATVTAAAGSRTVTCSSVTGVRVNDNVYVTDGPASGEYTVLKIAGSTLDVGRVVAEGTLSHLGKKSGSAYRSFAYHGALLTSGASRFSGSTVNSIVNLNGQSVVAVSVSTSGVIPGDTVVLAGLVASTDNGAYRVFAADNVANTITIDAILAAQPASAGTAAVSAANTYAPAELPTYVDSTFSAYLSQSEGGFGSSTWIPIVSVSRGVSETILELNTGSAVASDQPATIIGGLAGTLESSTPIYVGELNPALFNSAVVPSAANTDVLYMNTLDTTLATGTSSLYSLGIGVQAEPGDLVVFEGTANVLDENKPAIGGDATKITAYISTIPDVDHVTFPAAFPFDIPANTSFTVIRNRTPLGTGTVSSVSVPYSTTAFSAYPLGIGDAMGLAFKIVKNPVDAWDGGGAAGNIVVSRNGTNTFAEVVVPGDISGIALKDKLVINIPASAANGTYKIVAKYNNTLIIDASSNASLVSGTYVYNNTGPLQYSYLRTFIQQVSASTANNTRTLKLKPSRRAIKLTMSLQEYILPPTAAIGSPVTQLYGNNEYHGILESVDTSGAYPIWTVSPNDVLVDLFATAVTTVTTDTGTFAGTPDASGTTIAFPAGANLDAVVAGDRLNLSGVGVGIDGIYFIRAVDGIAKTVRISPILGAFSHAAVGLIERVPYVKMDSYNAKGIPTALDNNTGAFYAAGYLAAGSGDIGSLVHQGSSTGTLSGYNNGAFTWQVRPLSDTDTFSDVGATVTVDGSSAYGVLLEPASAPGINLTSVVLTTTSKPMAAATDTVTFLSRFGLSGVLFDNGALRLLDDGATHTTNLPTQGVTTAHQVAVLIGDRVGVYTIQAVNPYSLTLPGLTDSNEFVRIANAPGAQPMTIPTTGLSLSGPTLTISESSIGVFGAPGRILQIVGNGQTINLVIDHPLTQDQIRLRDTKNITLSPSVRWTWEILEGFTAQAWIVDPTALVSYRAYAPFVQGDTVYSSTTGVTSNASGHFIDPHASFSSALGSVDLATGDFELYLDSGSDAGTVGYKILSLVSDTELVLDVASLTGETAVSYHVQRQPNISAREGWYDGEITSASTIALRLPTGTDLTRYNTTFDVIIHVEPAAIAGLGAAWKLPPLSGTYNPTTSVLTVDVAHATAAIGDSWTDTVGFNAALFNVPARIYLQTRDKIMSRNLTGSALNTYNYYRNQQFFTLPVVKIQSVQLLDAATFQPIRNLNYTLQVRDPGLRYSAIETNRIQITEDLEPLKFQPLQVNYLADASIQGINGYLNADDTRVLSTNIMAKRFETTSIDVSVRVVSEADSAVVAQGIASYINLLRSTARLTKVELIKYLFDKTLITYIELATVRIDATYYQLDGTISVSSNADEVFGSDTSCYLAGNITVAKI